MGNYLKILLAIIGITVIPGGLYAQFTISNYASENISLTGNLDSVRVPRNYQNEFFNRSFWKAEQRVKRKQRNDVEFNAALQVSQTQFENWASGGDNTFSGRSTMYFRHQFQSQKFSIEEKFEARYGINYIEKKSFKNEDEFKANITTAWEMKGYWSYAATFALRSQFTKGVVSRTNRTKKSNFMAPGFLDLSVGFKYEHKGFTMVASPVGGSAVFILDDSLKLLGLNGVEKGKRQKWQVGPSLRMDYDREFAKKIIRVRSSFYSFSNIKEVPNMRWENTIDIRPTKFLTTTLYAMLFYDKTVETPKKENNKYLQFKYSFSIGLAYTFKNKKT